MDQVSSQATGLGGELKYPVDGLVRLDRLGSALFYYVFCIKLLMFGVEPGGQDRLGSALFYYVFCIKLLICLGWNPGAPAGQDRLIEA